ncbi:hypothetical protein D9C73_017472 [Collichthys lucidus]|uniref:Uncharacterized protein n=1 Tax=Collichthys lucidus TaxID=240159 RepID=A0A4U5V7K2_COLLU|nr:hypothetical protein D9C73_017472 [Collichthys lucidus]
MDDTDDYIWQRRIRHGVRNQKSAVLFPLSVEIGLEFNAAVEKKEKLDLSLLTNGVMLELCDFAKMVTKSELYFLFEMLEFNFDLGVDLDNEWHCYEYAKRVHGKIKQVREQVKFKPHRWKETFGLPDQNAIKKLIDGSEQLESSYPKRNNLVDISVLTDSSKNGQSSGNQEAESNTAESGVPVTQKVGRTGGVYPFCRELGVNMTFRPDDEPKQKLDPNLVTIGVMMELFNFSTVLCGTHNTIVFDLVKHNFGHDLDRTHFCMQLTKLTKRRYACQTAEDREALLKKPFQVYIQKLNQNRIKRKTPEVDDQELDTLTMANKRRETLRDNNKDINEFLHDSDLSYMCPVDFEAEMESGTEAGPEETKSDSLSGAAALEINSAVSLGVKQEEEEVFVSPVLPQTNGHNYSLHNSHPKNKIKSVADLFFEVKNDHMNVKTLKQKVWMRRATRSRQILNSLRVNDVFAHCRGIALDFNVGSGNKQKVDLKLLTNCVLLEIYRFATAMTKSLRSSLFDVLNNNFNFVLQDEVHQRNFLPYIMVKEKALQNHPHKQNMEFLSSPFRFPKVYSNVFQTGKDAETEQQARWDSPALATSQQVNTELYPFCNKLGLNLWLTEERPASEKLDLTTLTKGAVLEIFSFIRELCGEVREIVNDILEHNFDLDLQSGVTMAAQMIQRWYATHKSVMKTHSSSINRWLNKAVPLKRDSKPPKLTTGNCMEKVDAEDLKLSKDTRAFNGNMRQVKSYNICEEIGLDLNIRPKSKAKTKLDLKLLTRGVLFELHQYVRQNSERYVPTLYEILEYNFDLSSQNHRKVEFAWSIASQVLAMTGKKSRKEDYLSKVFELPFEDSEPSQVVCKEEPEDDFGELDLNDNSDIMFVRELRPVDIEVTVE